MVQEFHKECPIINGVNNNLQESNESHNNTHSLDKFGHLAHERLLNTSASLGPLAERCYTVVIRELAVGLQWLMD